MNPEYAAFLANKRVAAQATGREPWPVNRAMFDYQKACTEFCIRQGRAALFLDTGLGKTLCELEFALQGGDATNGKALILMPLAVARQIEKEADRFGYAAHVVRDASDVRAGINICNYDRLDKLDASAFGCVVLDESSVLKGFMGAQPRALVEAFRETPYRLCATATPAPNDHAELGMHAEFLGIMDRADMLQRWFINDGSRSNAWRLKGHAWRSFWDWMASWARMAENPADLGFDASRFALPPLNIRRHKTIGNVRSVDGLFADEVSAIGMHALKRQTAEARAEVVADLVRRDQRKWVVWLDTDYEADAVIARMPGDAVEVRGSHPIEIKERNLAAFSDGDARVIVTKPSIAGWGLCWDHCARMAFVGRTFSYEAWYQAVRRCWRFGQKNPVDVHLVVAEGEDQIGRVIDRKAADHQAMKSAMADAMRRDLARASSQRVIYEPTYTGRLPAWLTYAA